MSNHLSQERGPTALRTSCFSTDAPLTSPQSGGDLPPSPAAVPEAGAGALLVHEEERRALGQRGVDLVVQARRRLPTRVRVLVQPSRDVMTNHMSW